MESPEDPAERADRATVAGTTHWSRLVIQGTSEDERRAAHVFFYERYRTVVYRYFRHHGVDPVTAADLCQDFFLRTLSTSFLERADPSRGRFRNYLKTAVQRFLIDRWRRTSPQPSVVLDPEWSSLEPVSPCASPDTEFDREWAHAVVEFARRDVARWYKSRGRTAHFDAFLLRTYEGLSAREIAAKLGLSISGVDSVCARARRRMAEAIRREVAATVGNDADLDEEVAYLIELVRS
ncbi:MAG: sigma-70 family RNA polymerase sigma factor [Planctomycetes bacterium]|nr:sigma-70 family RNA polymerase sigma factor [Planctomycetota bacterium]